MEFQVMTFNLRLNINSDGPFAWPYRRKAVVEYLRQISPLIIGAQEVLDGMLEDLKQELPEYTPLGVTRREGEEATPILYKSHLLECKAYGTFWLSKTPDIPNSIDFNSAFPRICTWAEFMVKGDRTRRFRVFNTHLDHISREAQIEGMKIIIQRMNENGEFLPSLLMGDFNAIESDDVIQYLNEKARVKGKSLTSCYAVQGADYGATFHNYTGIAEGDPIDYIYATEGFTFLNTTIDREMKHGLYLSDHYPVRCTVRFEG